MDYESQHETKLRLLRLLTSTEGEQFLPPSSRETTTTPLLDFSAIQAHAFPLETPTSLRVCLGTVFTKVRKRRSQGTVEVMGSVVSRP